MYFSKHAYLKHKRIRSFILSYLQLRKEMKNEELFERGDSKDVSYQWFA